MNAYSSIADYVDQHQRALAATFTRVGPVVAEAASLLSAQVLSGKKMIAFGNGGSAAQASHFAAELVGRFARLRRPIPALALPMDGSTMTCIANDFGYEAVFERQLQCLAAPGDVAVAISTSGSSENVLRGLVAAHRSRAITIALVGAAGLKGNADVIIAAPSQTTSLVQELHLIVIHSWCAYLEAAIAGERPSSWPRAISGSSKVRALMK